MRLVPLALLAALCGCPKPTDAPPADAPDAADAGAAAARPLAVADEALADRFNNVFKSGDVRFAGRPVDGGLAAAKEAGVAVVVNLLTEPEVGALGFDEAAQAEAAGLTYVHLPMSGGVTRELVDRFAETMTSRDGDVLVHCGSSNRVGALWAAYCALHGGMSTEEALAHGEAAGMKSEKLKAGVEALLGADG